MRKEYKLGFTVCVPIYMSPWVCVMSYDTQSVYRGLQHLKCVPRFTAKYKLEFTAISLVKLVSFSCEMSDFKSATLNEYRPFHIDLIKVWNRKYFLACALLAPYQVQYSPHINFKHNLERFILTTPLEILIVFNNNKLYKKGRPSKLLQISHWELVIGMDTVCYIVMWSWNWNI